MGIEDIEIEGNLVPVKKITTEYLSVQSPTDRIWDFHRQNADYVASVLATPPESWIRKQSKRISECSGWLIFNQNRDADTQSLLLKLEKAPFCHVRFCPICQWRRSLRWKAKMYQALPKMAEEFPTARWVFLTLTTKNVPILKLREQFEAMNKAWGRLVKRRVFRHVVGWIRSVEVTRNANDRSAHPHFHCMLLLKSTYFKGTEYLTTPKWAKLWGEVMRVDYQPIVDIRVIRGRDGDGLEKAVAETLKYSVKEFDMLEDSAWLIELIRQAHKTRAVASGGHLKKLLGDKHDDQDQGDLRTDLACVDVSTNQVRFNWSHVSQRYQRRLTALVLEKRQ